MDISHIPSSPANDEPENRKMQASYEGKDHKWLRFLSYITCSYSVTLEESKRAD